MTQLPSGALFSFVWKGSPLNSTNQQRICSHGHWASEMRQGASDDIGYQIVKTLWMCLPRSRCNNHILSESLCHSVLLRDFRSDPGGKTSRHPSFQGSKTEIPKLQRPRDQVGDMSFFGRQLISDVNVGTFLTCKGSK